MAKYYCPYCSPGRRLSLRANHGKKMCAFCGEQLVEVKLISPKQIVAFVVAAAFLMPLVLMASLFIQEANESEAKESLSSMSFLLNAAS